MRSERNSTLDAESRWLSHWVTGPTEGVGPALAVGEAAPGLVLADESGVLRHLAEFWAEGPALVMFWRHFGCGCGVSRAERLLAELPEYERAGLRPVIIGQGEPARAAAYQAQHRLPCPVLHDPELTAYRAFGLGQWGVERVLYDAPPAFWGHDRETGSAFQDARRVQGRAPVDDPWRATGEFVVTTEGRVALAYYYQYCEDFPDPRVLTTAARLARS